MLDKENLYINGRSDVCKIWSGQMHLLPKFLNSPKRKYCTHWDIMCLVFKCLILLVFKWVKWFKKKHTILCYKYFKIGSNFAWHNPLVCKSILNDWFLENKIDFFFYIKHQGLEEFENKIEKISSGQDDNSWLGQLYSQVSPLLLTSLISIGQKRDHFWIFQ